MPSLLQELSSAGPTGAPTGLARKMPGYLKTYHSKLANMGGDQESSFEQAFAALAYSYIKDKAPRLLDYMIGFQLVDRTDDNRKAVGIFGFKIGEQWVYAPVFFLNSKLKGHQLLYLKRQDLFVPLKENWINYVLNKRPHVLGKGDPRSMRQLGVMQPDIRRMGQPPQSKQGSVAETLSHLDWDPDFHDFAPVYAALTHDMGRPALTKFAGLSQRLSLFNVVSSDLRLCKMAMKAAEAYPAIGEAIEKFHGKDFFKSALLKLREDAVKQAAAETPDDIVTSFYFGKDAPPARRRKPRPVTPKVANASCLDRLIGTPSPEMSELLSGNRVKRAADSVEVVGEDEVMGEPITLTDEERAKLLRDGLLIKDHREGDEVSVEYNTQHPMEITNPDASGIFDVLIKPGDFTECLVICDAHGPRGQLDFMTVVRLSPKDWVNAHRTTIWTKPNTSTKETFKDWYDKQSKGDSLSKGGTYVAVSVNGEGSAPFTIERALGDGRYEVRFHDYNDRRRPGYLPTLDHPVSNGDYDNDYYGQEMVFINDREGTRFRSTQGTLFVPAEHKIITIKQPEQPKEDEGCCCGPTSFSSQTHSENDPFRPGSWADLQMQILQKTAALRIYSDGNEISINGSHLVSKKAGLVHLVKYHGFREKTARDMILRSEKARLRGTTENFRVKYAGPYDQMTGMGPQSPMIPDQQFGYDQDFGGVSTMPEEYNIPVDDMSSQYTDPSTYDPSPEQMPDPMAMQVAQSAGQQGQKEVFDTAMISGLLRSVRQDALVDRFMPELLSALDRLGRILFMFYWHNDEFTDRYGKADMPELEDTLINAQEVLGDLVLFIKEKDVEPLGGRQGEPDIESTTGD